MDQTHITVVCISDLHGAPLPPLPPLPSGDILIIAGDLTEGLPSQLISRHKKISSLKDQFEHILVIGGNHDRALDSRCDVRNAAIYNDAAQRIECRKEFHSSSEFTYLENAATTLHLHNGQTLKVWASPASLATSHQTCFGYLSAEAEQQWNQIPDDTDILITHGPPLGYLDGDRKSGCKVLTSTLWRVRPLLHVFGHIHEGHGTCVLRYDDVQRQYEENVSSIKDASENEVSTSTKAKYIPPALRRTAAEAMGRLELPAQMTTLPGPPYCEGGKTILVNASLREGCQVISVHIPISK
ncbi:Metallo-dependent phosphatase-like protein [Xylogone sp. PMI_703]|nr:Metallo-dependent phosphatase-like protein [Xylogone sp. PMI_703]